MADGLTRTRSGRSFARHSYSSLFLALLVIGLRPGAAFGEAPPDDPAVVSARGHFQAGRVYFDQGDLKRALVEFREAARDADSPALDFNIARTWDRLGDAARAVNRYQKYLARSPAADDRAEVEARVADLLPLVGSLTIKSSVSGTVLLVDLNSDETPTHAVSADFDGDGNLDLALCDQTVAVVEVLRGNGLGGFQAPQSFNAPQVYVSFLAPADLDGDGRPDLVVGSYKASVGVLLNTSK